MRDLDMPLVSVIRIKLGQADAPAVKQSIEANYLELPFQLIGQVNRHTL